MSKVDAIVGRVGRAHGIKGEVSVEVLTDEPERRFQAGNKLRIKDFEKDLSITSVRKHKGRLLVMFAEICDRNGCEEIQGKYLTQLVTLDEFPSGEEEYFDRQLIGLAVECDNDLIGRVVDVTHLPAQDLLIVDINGEQRMVPFVKDLVPVVDLVAKKIEITSIPGLLDDSGVVEVGTRRNN